LETRPWGGLLFPDALRICEDFVPDASAVRTASRPFDQHEGIAFHDHAVDKRPAIAAQFSRSDTADWNFSNFNNDQFNSRLLHGMSCAEVNALV
jgi:hypothetical protein